MCSRLKDSRHRDLQADACLDLGIELLGDRCGSVVFVRYIEDFQEDTRVEQFQALAGNGR